jgi:hypothetical protein
MTPCLENASLDCITGGYGNEEKQRKNKTKTSYEIWCPVIGRLQTASEEPYD